ncbi:TPA: GNAT family N-acetyltransferase [Legionella pneumophila subsp. pneumophila]|nr:GNAT family N-acetyltransferase [Legionella pneumophila]HAT9133373.1 GNAT family N-acetyltransferase [Legionella pneumophila subsp. pneumophila]HAT8256950.1 GNAT family N-acetyltransferase [Legionella pneumophila]HAT8260277.1 GNAT family N-acetyltransferase [Legionella pneumophila]HAT8269643.1 GNAT family N-acetyltransferase [Legionella pneumophila]
MMLTGLRLLTKDLKILNGKYIQLEPITSQHREELRKAANHEQIWQYMPQKATGKLFNSWFDDCLEKMSARDQITYAVRCKKEGDLKGATSFYDIQPENKRLALGYSWYIPKVWGTTTNPESKLLMLYQAFDAWGINRVELGTDSRNIHSYRAIKKLGATEEGVLRQHMILHNQVITDTIMFSILFSEWPAVKERLMQRLNYAAADKDHLAVSI